MLNYRKEVPITLMEQRGKYVIYTKVNGGRGMENKFGKYLSQKLKERGLSQSQLSYYSGISDAHISRLSKEERGLPKIETLRKIASALKMSLQEMLKELGYIMPETEKLPENLQTFLKSDMKPEDITADEVEILASHSYYEGAETTPEGYKKILGDLRNRPEVKIVKMLNNQPLKIREDVAKMIETYITLFGDKG